MPAMPAPMTHTSVSKLSLSGWPIGGWAMALHTDWCFISRSSSGAQMEHHQAPQNACRGAGGAYGSGEARAAIEVQDLSGAVVLRHRKDVRLGGMLPLPDATGQDRPANSLVLRFLIGAHMAVPAAAHNTETDGVDTDRCQLTRQPAGEALHRGECGRQHHRTTGRRPAGEEPRSQRDGAAAPLRHGCARRVNRAPNTLFHDVTLQACSRFHEWPAAG